MEPPPLGSILIRRAYDPRDPAMASGNNDDIQNLNAFLGGWSAAVARMAIPSDATLRGSSQGASAVDFQHAACYRAARRLLGILPPGAIAFPLGIDVSQLTRHGVAPTLTIHLRLAATFAPDTIAVGARALDELQQFARASDVTITPLVAFAYLEKADTDARERVRGRRDDAARRGATPTARVTTGSSVRQSLAMRLVHSVAFRVFKQALASARRRRPLLWPLRGAHVQCDVRLAIRIDYGWRECGNLEKLLVIL